MELSDKELKTISAYATASTYAEAGEIAKTDDSIAPLRTFWHWMKTNPMFKKEFDQAKREFVGQLKEEVATKNFFLHATILDNLKKKNDNGELKTKDQIELLKITGREEFKTGKKALDKAVRIHDRIKEERQKGVKNVKLVK